MIHVFLMYYFFEKYIFIRFFNFIFFGLNEDKVHFSVIPLKNFFGFIAMKLSEKKYFFVT